MLSTDGLTVEGKDYSVALSGRGSLLTGSIEATAELAMKGAAAAAIPLAITGSWRAPLIGPGKTTMQDDMLEDRQPRG
jgi:hypothetical protein